MSDCFNNLFYQGYSFQYNHCKQEIVYNSEIDRKFTVSALFDLSKACFDAYLYHLEEHSDDIVYIGKGEYEILNKELISLITPYDPLKFSFSISQDPSLHFFVRFASGISLFIETFIDIEEGNDTYIQIYRVKNLLFEVNSGFDNAITQVKDILEAELGSEEKTYNDLHKKLKKCHSH